MSDRSVLEPALCTRRRFLLGAAGGLAGAAAWLQGWPHLMAAPAPKDEPNGQMTWAVHVTIAPTWFDPAETSGVITPYMFLYAIHDALIKPMPDNPMAPSLATAWTESADGLTYDFELREGVKFHNGDPFTAEDVRYSFERYKGTAAALLKEKVKAVDIVHPHRVRFHLHEPWPDFLTFYGGLATGASWIVPEHYTEKLGSEKFKEQPIGLGPYRVAEHQPGVELVLEANTAYWRKTPAVKRLVFKSVPDPTTRQAINEAETLGHSVLTGSIIPHKFDYALQLEPYAYDPAKAKQLLKEAGYPNGFDAGECSCDAVYAGVVEAAVNDLAAVGIRAKVRPVERAAIFAAHREKTVKNLTRQGSAAFGNAATRIETFMYSKGAQSFLQDPEIDAWYEQQATERNRQKRQAILHRIQQKVYDGAYFGPFWELGFLCASGPRAAVSGLGLIPLFAYSAPLEEVRLRS